MTKKSGQIEIHAADAVLVVTSPEIAALILKLAIEADQFPDGGLSAIHAHFREHQLNLEYQVRLQTIAF